ncbi:replication-relaxation family protein [Nocardia wallacei]|uniref:replication-relaxation family protein n=1 Tax=Nocardia wallacei TaxID=480035 RepID=UPI002454B5F4|nr:replication-relaxation family protein [Nocardia wallacei]
MPDFAPPLRQKDLRATRHRKPDPPDLTDLAVRLTPRDRWLLRMLYEHRVLTSHQIADLAFGTPRVARRRLLDLYRYGVISRFTPYRHSGTWPAHYILAPAGAQVLAAEEGLDVTALRWRYDRAIAVAAGIQLAHAVGVGTWFISLVRHARRHRDRELQAWWSQTRCQRLWGDLVRPDAYGRWTAGRARIEFFLEYDLGTESLTQVTRKLDGYARLADATAITTPVLLWLPTHRRETHARQHLHTAWRTLPDPAAVPVATAAADLLDHTAAEPSPADAVWQPLDTSGTDRLALHQLPAAWPRYTPPAAPARSTSDTADTDGAVPPTVLPAPAPTPPATEPGES